MDDRRGRMKYSSDSELIPAVVTDRVDAATQFWSKANLLEMNCGGCNG
jgi:hypothetical protein